MTKLIILIVVMCIMASFFTGCGFVPGTYNQSGGVFRHSWANKLCQVVDDGNEQVLKSDGSPLNGFASKNLDPTTDYGFAPKDHGILVIRDVVSFAMGSVLGSPIGATDKFCSNSLGTGVNLNPASVATNAMNAFTDAKAKSAMSTALNGVNAMALAVFIAVWSMGFISQVVNEKFTMETMLKTFMQLLCGILIMNNVDRIVGAFAGAARGMIKNAGGTLTFGAFQQSLQKILNNGIMSLSVGFDLLNFIELPLGTIWLDWGSLVALMLLLFPMWGALQCAYKVVSMIFMNTLELALRITLAPIPIAFSIQQGFGPEMIRYFRSVFACALQPVLIAAGAACASDVASGVLTILNGGSAPTGSGNGLLQSVAVGMAFIILSAYFSETKRLCQEIVAR